MKLVNETPNGKIYHGDCREYLHRISKKPPGDILIFTDVPYGHGKDIVAGVGGKWKHLKVDYPAVNWNERIPRSWVEIIKRFPFVMFGGNRLLWTPSPGQCLLLKRARR